MKKGKVIWKQLYSCEQIIDTTFYKAGREVCGIYLSVTYPRVRVSDSPWKTIREEELYFVCENGRYIDRISVKDIASAKRFAKRYCFIDRRWAKWKKV